MGTKLSRREVIKNLGLASGAISLGGILPSFASEVSEKKNTSLAFETKVNHSVCRWPYSDIPLDSFAKSCAEMGIKAIDLLKPSEWDTVEKEGLVCSLATDDFADIKNGFNEKANHSRLQNLYKDLIDKASDHGIKQVICFSGNKRQLDDKTGMENCAVGLTPLLDYAENKNVELIMELLNSKVDHIDYQCDHTKWGVTLCDMIQAPNFSLLYDIYHMQIMEGDIIRSIRDNHQYLTHFHTGGVPGRNEINDSQELNYSAIVEAIVETGYNGFIAQEFVPTYPDKLKALKEAISICTV
ncbi:MAG: TIM barrel protein [Gillisia sp.]